MVILGLLPKLVSGEEANYTVVPLFSNRQRVETSSYFDLPLFPGEKELIQLEITNQTAQKKEFAIQVNEGITNSNGVVDYIRKEPRDSTISYLMSELVTGPELIEVPPHGKETVSLTVAFPPEDFSGIILGGIVVSPVESETTAGQVHNQYTHTIAIVIQGSELVTEPVIQMHQVAIGQQNYRNMITFNFQNPLAMLLDGLTIAVEIRKEGQQRILYQESASELRMAPNSNFDFPVLIGDHFQPGTYEATVTAQLAEQEWRFTETFVIEDLEATELNNETIDTKSNSGWWIILSIGAMLIISLAFIGRIYLRRSK